MSILFTIVNTAQKILLMSIWKKNDIYLALDKPLEILMSTHSIGGSGSAERSEPSASSTLVQDDPTHLQNSFDFDDSKRGVHVAYGAHEDDRGCGRIKVRERQRVNAAGVVGAPRGSSEDYISPRMSIRTIGSVGKGGSPGRRLRKVRMVEGDWDWLRDGDWGDPSPLDQAVR
ncbi:hypothetical protein TREMEDRAFT_58233 [Tremella mesenterica DSM 1558]|uniref:uncharacterized protein n=1 Tax=Tremella mesenterica (strain ATCC 24925 / CBS 8224 / DSM 1558 / NBRC 9311 / NRRL Y-6157 / RJB 2259-6 / UBC 559-6) TaxID=578456 RepID=UPI0003F49605|nr:uncharacterized protein TREMEDRAFT_58233 [Tremella mesenterica DSM 1558]EIW72079.1 hypothetical protein TREMEDRAFT_58233 [Tremella mesenterica DSM 1558]